VTVLAISMDPPEDSRALARDYGIAFPLLSDADGQVSRTYAGVTSDRSTLPGVTIIDRDGKIRFRQVASAKDDRMPAAELLATLDRTLGTSGPGVAASDAAIDRAQLRVALGGGGVHAAGDTGGTVVGAIAGLVPLGRYVLVGPWLGFEPRKAPVDLDAALVVRAPIWASAGALELGAVAGWTPWRDTGGNAGVHLGVWFATSPRWAVQLELGVTEHGLGQPTGSTEAALTLGVTRLIHRPW
jgi:AhpC/TSA family